MEIGIFRNRDEKPDDASTYAYRSFIGYTGFILPFTLYVVAGLIPSKALTPWRFLDSVSAYYYTSGIAIFVGALTMLALFLFFYQGYKNASQQKDRIAALTASVSAFGVAFFPTHPPEGVEAPSWWFKEIALAHLGCALVLFLAFAYFSLFLFTKSNLPREASVPVDKKWRNRIYRFCGCAIIVCIVLAGAAIYNGWPMFWPEAFALWLFAVSWLTKGRAERPFVALTRRALTR